MSDPVVASRPRILKATAVALVVATALLFIAVLPAEYGIDPLGTGRMLGLTALAGVNEIPEPSSTAPVPAMGPWSSASRPSASRGPRLWARSH